MKKEKDPEISFHFTLKEGILSRKPVTTGWLSIFTKKYWKNLLTIRKFFTGL
jgi:hypothetical protein